jgi:hypothetical protein
MALQASDELRHPWNEEYSWRESLYFNFNDPENKIGGWIYYWVVPNKEQPSGMLVSLYHGSNSDLEGSKKANAAPGHLTTDGDNWLYFFNRDVDHLVPEDFDDVELCGLRLRRVEPLKRYEISFEDDAGNGLDLACRFLSAPYDYSDGVHPTPWWMADNRYHRAWKVDGELRIAGKTYRVNCTGDSDHSWGLRDGPAFCENLFKMWSFQTSDGRLAISVLKQGIDGVASGKEIALGFVQIDGKMASAATIETRASYDANGVQHEIDLTVTDALGRTVKAHMPRMHSYLGAGDAFWGYEGVGDYQVDGYGVVPGLSSYFWPDHVTPASLHAGQRR